MAYFIDESLSDTDFTPAEVVAQAFGTPRRYESITVHHWGSFGQTHDGVLAFFMRPNSPTSCHFVASDGRIHCLVSPLDASWAAGNAYGNATSIHIEARPEATDGDYATVAWLIAQLRALYGDLPLKPHNAWAATACPGKWDLARLDREALAAATTTPIKKEGFLMSLPDKDQIEVRDNLRKVVNALPGINEYTGKLLWAGFSAGGVQYPGLGKVIIENQRRITNSAAEVAGLREIVDQLAKGQGVAIDYARIESTIQAAVKDAVADGIEITGEIKVGGE